MKDRMLVAIYPINKIAVIDSGRYSQRGSLHAYFYSKCLYPPRKENERFVT
jgi:hypothetical protein